MAGEPRTGGVDPNKPFVPGWMIRGPGGFGVTAGVPVKSSCIFWRAVFKGPTGASVGHRFYNLTILVRYTLSNRYNH